jgi:mannose-6-phosphate isomerase-like protein (cupin superfamily)
MPDPTLIDTGTVPLEQTVLDLAPADRSTRATADAEEVLFVLSGAGSLSASDGGMGCDLEPESGVVLPPGTEYELANTGAEPLQVISVRLPDPVRSPAGASRPISVRHLAEQEAQAATTEREFRIVADPDHGGLQSATHFVGYIPTSKAPFHFHTYDEVIYVLDGEGTFHAGETHEPLHPGSRITLPARTVHCLENTGSEVMRVVAVFRPAGSPAAAYYPDGTPAYAGTPPLTVS